MAKIQLDGRNLPSDAMTIVAKLKRIKTSAQRIATGSNGDVINLYYAIQDLDDELKTIVNSGVQLTSLVTPISQIIGQDFTAMLTDLQALRNTDWPAFKAFAIANQDEIFKQEFGPLQSQYVAISSATKTAATQHATQILTRFV